MFCKGVENSPTMTVLALGPAVDPTFQASIALYLSAGARKHHGTMHLPLHAQTTPFELGLKPFLCYFFVDDKRKVDRKNRLQIA